MERSASKESKAASGHPVSRRRFLKMGAAAAVSVITPLPVAAAVRPFTTDERALSFYNLHTAERLRVCYYCNGAYDPGALGKIDHILRDHRTDQHKRIDPALLDLLHRICGALETASPLQVISGYRSSISNRLLLRYGRGVAARSLHLEGRAVDIRLADRTIDHIRRAAVRLHAGGVGYYPQADFVHLDTGRFRCW